MATSQAHPPENADAAPPGVLEGLRVIDFSRHMAGPYGTMFLSDYGADIVKVESLPAGDPTRSMGTAYVEDVAGLFLMWNRGKRSVAVDLRSEEGLRVVRRLVADADVLVENYRPGVADRIGIGWEEMRAVNPRLIYCSVAAFGQTGPLRDYPGTDPVVQAVSGVMSVTGEADGDPVLVGIPIADFTAAMALVQAVLLGVIARERTGRGQYIDVPMMGALAYGLTTRLASYWYGGDEPRRNGSAHSVVAPYQVYRAADGEFVAGAWAEDAWPRFCKAIERADLIDDPRFARNTDRVAHLDELNALLGEIFAQRTVAEWQERFHEERALFGPVLSVSEVMDHPQMRALGLVQTLEHPTIGPMKIITSPVTMSDTPGRATLPPPLLGQHTRDVLTEVGFSPEEISRLATTGVIAVND